MISRKLRVTCCGNYCLSLTTAIFKEETMFATAARFLLSAIVLLLAITVSPFIFQEPVADSAPVWSLRVLQTPDEVKVGEKVTVEVVLLRNGLPGQVSHSQPVLTVLTDAGTVQDEANPLLVVSQAVRGERTERTQRWVAEYTAVRPGAAQIHARVVGNAGDETDTWIEAEGVSETIGLRIPQAAPSSTSWLGPLYFGGLISLCGLSYYLYRRQVATTQY
jgi:hypothetical protein